MKKTLLSLSAFTLLFCGAASAQSGTTVNGAYSNSGVTDQNNPSPSTVPVGSVTSPSNFNGTEQITGANRNRVDPSAQLNFVNTTSGVQVEPVQPAAQPFTTGVQPTEVVPAQSNTSNAFGSNGNRIFSQSRGNNSSATYNVTNQNTNTNVLTTPYSTVQQPNLTDHATGATNSAESYNAAGAETKIAVRDVNVSRRTAAGIARTRAAMRAGQYMSVYPNPARSFTNILLANPAETKVHVSVVNLNGQVVQNFSFAPGGNNFSLDVSTLITGVYSVHVQEEGQPVQNIKLTVAH